MARLPRALGAGLGLGAAVAGALCGPAALATLAGWWAVPETLSGPAGLGLAVIFVLLELFLGLVGATLAAFLAVREGLVLPIVAVEEGSVRDAFRRARGRSRGHHAKGLGLIVCLAGVVAAGSLLPSLFVSFPSFEGASPSTLRGVLPRLVRAELWSTALGELVAIFTHGYALLVWARYSARLAERGAAGRA